MRRERVWWQRPSYDWQPTLSKTATPFKTINQFSQFRKWHLSSTPRTPQKRARAQWLGRWSRTIKTCIDSHISKQKSTKNWTIRAILDCMPTAVKNLATSLEVAIRRWKRNKNNEKTFRFKTGNLQHSKHLHFVDILYEQTILQKSAGTILTPLIDLKGSIKTNHQIIHK